MEKNNTITLSGKIVEQIFRGEWSDRKIDYSGVPEEYHGWHVEADEDTGDYDSAKSSMVDFEVYLYRPWTKEDEENGYVDGDKILMGTAIGGYYYQGDYSFDFGKNSYDFYPPAPETPESKFRDFLMDIAQDNLSMDKMIKRIEKEIKSIKD